MVKGLIISYKYQAIIITHERLVCNCARRLCVQEVVNRLSRSQLFLSLREGHPL